MSQHITRRRALSGAATVGLTPSLLSACGDDSTAVVRDPTGASPDDSPSQAPPEAPSQAPTETPNTAISTADVPVGGGLVVADQRVVVTQPSEGEFKVFSAVCTHTGCLVGSVSRSINCPCHGSAFDLVTGEVRGGPASAPLPPIDFTIENDQVVLS